jgi:hypothetical protein
VFTNKGHGARLQAQVVYSQMPDLCKLGYPLTVQHRTGINECGLDHITALPQLVGSTDSAPTGTLMVIDCLNVRRARSHHITVALVL